MKIKSLILLTIATLCCTALSAKPLPQVMVKDSIQNGETYLFVDTLINTGGEYAHRFYRAAEGKPDSIVNLSLKTFVPKQNIAVAYKDSIVEGETYLFIDQLLTEGGEYTATIARKAVPGDSTITLTLSLMPNCQDTMVAIADSIIEGETYLFIDTLLTTEGTYYRTLPSVAGCDSTIALTLSLMPNCQDTMVAIADSIIDGETYLFIDTLLTTEGTYYRTLPRVAGCDSTIALTLSLMPNCQDTMVAIADSIIDGETYLFIDTLLTTEGTYYRTLPRVAGCDSTIALTLSLMPNCQDTMVAIADSIIDGEMYLFIDTLLTTEGTYYRTLPRVAGCDSTIALTLSLMPNCQDTAVAYTDSIFVGESYLFIDTLITMNDADTVTCQRTLPRVAGCDSTINLTLIARYVYTRDTLRDTISDSLCYKEAFTDRLGVTYYPAQDTVVMDTISDVRIDTVGHTITNYDSIYRYELKVWPATEYPTAVKDTIDEDKLPYKWRPYEGVLNQIYVAGVFYDTVKNVLGCDSIVYELDLAVRTVTRHEAEPVDIHVCKGTEYKGRLTTHTINGLTEWQDSLRLREGLTAIDSIYKYKVDTLPTKIPDSEISQIKAYCDYPVDYSYAWLNVAEFVNPYFIFAEVTDTIWEVETKNGWNPAATTILTGEDKTIRVRCTVVTECETTYSTSEPYEVKVASADDKPEELTIPATQKYGSRIIMIDKKATEDLGWTIPEVDVTWYQVVGTPDNRSYDSDPATWDDKKVMEGQYYYTLANGDTITGQYYAIVSYAMKKDVSMTCGVELRTNVLTCNQPQPAAPALAPNLVAPNESMTLSGLDATQNYTIRVISMDGSTVNNFNVNGNEKLNLKAASVQGMYIVNVWNGQENVSLKYIVK